MYLSTQILPANNNSINFTIDEAGFLLNAEDWDELFAEEVLGYSSGQLSSEHLDETMKNVVELSQKNTPT